MHKTEKQGLCQPFFDGLRDESDGFQAQSSGRNGRAVALCHLKTTCWLFTLVADNSQGQCQDTTMGSDIFMTCCPSRFPSVGWTDSRVTTSQEP